MNQRRMCFKDPSNKYHSTGKTKGGFKMRPLKQRAILFLSWMATFIVMTYACEYQRLDPGHTMCIHMPRSCMGKTLIRSGGVTCQDKQVILETHNRLRQMLALGQIRGQPASLDMRELVWDEELAAIAQRWADQCTTGHDRRRNVDRFNVGQNVAATWTFDKPSPMGEDPEFKRQIEAWFYEVTQVGFRPQDIEPFNFNRQAGHYSQIAWSETYAVGCGYSYFRDPQRGYTKLYVCNYGPGGNVIGASMYRVGLPGQAMCITEGLSPSRRYPGLCEIKSGVDYRDLQCYANSNLEHPVQHLQPPVQPISNVATANGNLATWSPHQTGTLPQPTVTEMILRGIQSPFAGLTKLLNPYNLFG